MLNYLKKIINDNLFKITVIIENKTIIKDSNNDGKNFNKNNNLLFLTKIMTTH
jgi:hypothetical protein